MLQQLQVRERERLGLPPVQQLLRFTNNSMTECYANAGLGVLLSNPLMAQYLAGLTSNHPLVLNLRSLTLQDPSIVSSLETLRVTVAELLPGRNYFGQIVQHKHGTEELTAEELV